MDFILTTFKPENYQPDFQTDDGICLSYILNNRFYEREFVYEDAEILIIVDANKSFVDKIKSDEKSIKNIEKNWTFLQNGYVVIADKRTPQIQIYTDIFGYYHLFSIKKGSMFAVSSDFKKLLEFSNKKVDDFSLLDMYLFNYTLLDRTIFSDIKRIKGGTKTLIEETVISFNTVCNYADKFTYDGKRKVDSKEFGQILCDVLNSEIFEERETCLTMTAGFDSRALLAACNHDQRKISSFTFGQKGNIEIETIRPFIKGFTKEHYLFDLDLAYLKDLRDILISHIELSLDNPTILDLPHYTFIKNKLDSKNVIAGFMGGEMMVGQSIGAQVTITEFAARLLTCSDTSSLRDDYTKAIRFSGLFNHGADDSREDYLLSLSEYTRDMNNKNVLKFLVNEKYSKFFGTINKVFKNHSNIIVPLMNFQVIDYLVNSNISFLHKKPFQKNPFENMKAKIFYAKVIQNLCPALGETKFDRLYAVNDLCKPYRIFIAGKGYIQSHVFKKNKKIFSKPHNYDQWFKDIIIQEFTNNELNNTSVVLNNISLSDHEYDNFSTTEKKKLSNILSVILAFKQLQKI